MTTKFKKSFSPMLICWNDIKIHLGFEDSYFVPPPTDSSQLFSSHTVLALRSGGVLLSKYVCDCVQLFWALSFPMGTVAPTQWEGIQNISTGL